MKLKMIAVVIVLAITTVAFNVAGQSKQSQDPRPKVDETSQQPNDSRLEQLAERIITGQISEEQFDKLNLTDDEVLEVFRHIKLKREWQMDDQVLAEILAHRKAGEAEVKEAATAAAIVSCANSNQTVEMEYGARLKVYPLAQVLPRSGECGTDNNDLVLVYGTPGWPSPQPDKVRMWTNLWWVRDIVNGCFLIRFGGVRVNGLCSNTTRACIGGCAKWLGRDLNSLYLWVK